MTTGPRATSILPKTPLPDFDKLINSVVKVKRFASFVTTTH